MKKWPKKVPFSQSKMTQHIFSMKKRLIMAAIFLFMGAILFTSCKKTETDLGVDALPDDDLLGVEVDTFEVNTYTVREDSLRSDEFSNNLLGSMNDPIFGKTKTSIYCQVRLEQYNPTFDIPNTIVDSVVLSINIKGHYGYENPQTFEVYEITEPIYRDSSYYTTTVKDTSSANLVKPGFGTFTPSVFSKPIIGGDTLDPQIRIRLNETFGDMIVNAGSNLVGETEFISFFKGIYITVNNPSQGINEGGVYRVDMEHTDTRITIYYHDLAGNKEYDMPINDKCARFNHMDHYYSGTDIEQQLLDSLGSDFYYIQAGQGLVANLSFPGLMDLVSNGPVIVNKAELYLPVQYYTADPFSPPGSMIVYGLDDENEIFTLPDYSLGVSIFGGAYDDEKKAYKFNLLRHIQGVLRGDVANNELRLVSTASVVSVNRAMMSGKNSPNRDKPYLKIYYTKYE